MSEALCSVEDCGKKVHAKGLCFLHYSSNLKARKRMAEEAARKAVSNPELTDEELLAVLKKPLDKKSNSLYKGLNSLQRFITYNRLVTGLHLVSKDIVWDLYQTYPFEDKIEDRRKFFSELKLYLEVTKESVRLTIDPFVEGLDGGRYVLLGNTIVYAEAKEARKQARQEAKKEEASSKKSGSKADKEIEEIFGD